MEPLSPAGPAPPARGPASSTAGAGSPAWPGTAQLCRGGKPDIFLCCDFGRSSFNAAESIFFFFLLVVPLLQTIR